jgi:uncharacterized protein YcfJ
MTLPKIHCENCNQGFYPARPAALNRYTIIGVLLGGFLGSSIGIAGAFGAIAGTIPGGILGAYVARKIAYSTPECPHCGFKHVG